MLWGGRRKTRGGKLTQWGGRAQAPCKCPCTSGRGCTPSNAHRNPRTCQPTSPVCGYRGEDC